MTWSVFHEYFSQVKEQVRELTRMVLFSQEDSERDTPTAPNVCPGETSSQSSGILSRGPSPSPAIIPVASTPEGSSVLRVKRLHPAAHLPIRVSTQAAGLDVLSCSKVMAPARGPAVVPLGIAVVVPSGTYGRLLSSSGLALTKGVEVGAGVAQPEWGGVE